MKDNLVFLRHIIDEINFLITETGGKSFEEFMKDEVLKRAAARSLEIIGEAAKNLPGDFREAHNDVDWKKLAGLRDKIIHYYFGVNWDIAWDVIRVHLPKIKAQIELILQ